MFIEGSAETNGHILPRPMRVAYFVEANEHLPIVLSAIFAECYTRWAGRYTLIVPCEAGRPREEWIPWLKLHDPDIIYSYCDFDGAVATEIYLTYGPAHLKKHKISREEKFDLRHFMPRLPVTGLTALSVAPQYARAHPLSAPQPMFIVDYAPGQDRDQFVEDNFGSPNGSFGWWPLPGNLSDIVRTIVIASPQIQADKRRGYSLGEEIVSGTSALLRLMATKRSSYGLAQLSSDSSPRIDIRVNGPEAFTLVVGDSSEDRLLFWHERILMPVHIGRDFASLIVSPSKLGDADFRSALVEFIKARNSIHPPNGTSWVMLKSASISTPGLREFAEQLNQDNRWTAFFTEERAPSIGIPPTEALLRTTGYLTTGSLFDGSASWRSFAADAPKISPPTVTPAHMQGLNTLSRATEGLWAVDIDLERANNLSRHSNVKHKWILPRRLRMHGAFRSPYQAGRSNVTRYARTSHRGHLALLTGFGEDLPLITNPDDDTVFRHALTAERDWPWPFQSSQVAPHGGLYEWIRSSDKGRYLLGSLRLLDGLISTGSVLLNHFWADAFGRLGAALGSDRSNAVRSSLEKRVRVLQLDDPEAMDRLVKIVLTEAQHVRMPMRSMSFAAFEKMHEPFLEQERLSLIEHGVADAEDWIDREKGDLIDGIQWLCARTVLHQGYEWKCRTCFHVNWDGISELRAETHCEVCGADQLAPVNKSWDFRLNGFLREALKEHGVRALIWCLVKLEQKARDSFYFLGPHDLFARHPDGKNASADHEADLICVIDGKVYLCEVKSSARDIKLSSLVEVAKRLSPDVVLLAVMEEETPKTKGKLSELITALDGTGVKAELLCFRPSDIHEHVGI